MRPITALLLAFCAGALSACGARSAPAPAQLVPVAGDALVYYDNAGGLRDSVRVVIRDQAELSRLWSRLAGGRGAPPPLPTVDFEREMLLAVAAGRKTPGDEIHVDSVGERRETTSAGERRVLAVAVRSYQGCGRFNTDAYPVAIVRVRRVELPVVFVERPQRSADCPR